MATRISEVYDAFIAAGAPEEKARKAAEALANYENRFTRIDSELLILKWMVGFAIALNVAILTRYSFIDTPLAGVLILEAGGRRSPNTTLNRVTVPPTPRTR